MSSSPWLLSEDVFVAMSSEMRQSPLSGPSSSSSSRSWSLSEDRALRRGPADSCCLRRQPEEMMKILVGQTLCGQDKVCLPESRGAARRGLRVGPELPESLSHSDGQLWSQPPHKDTADGRKSIRALTIQDC